MNIGVDWAIAVPGYSLVEQLYCGSKTEVYRAVREADRQSVVIKLLRREYPTFTELLQFRNQYAIAKNLNIPGIVRFYSLEPYRNSYALVMEDFGGISLRQYLQQQLLSITEILTLAIQLTNILYNLYQQSIIHKDIKPTNILINPETKQVKLIDFSIASLLPRETQSIISPNILEGTLAYLSPEQTGRMNRGIDYRSDFYSLGVTLFELLSGQLPFISNDPIELVHCHIAKQPPLLGNREEIPQVISDIVMKLMAKNAEDRYQSTLGLKYDLEKCLVEIKETGKVEYFEIGQRDVCDRFLIPEKLYGRESEVQQLLEAFERVADGNSEMILVAGFSGIGKTAVVNEVHKPIVRQRGYFIKGKFDQFNRDIPFSAFVQSFRDLMGQLFTETDQQLQQWKTKILAALGENGQVIIDVIPELARIIGEQSPAPELSGVAAQNRFNLLFQNFIQVFKTKEQPLVIFLDDLQWADSASLQLMQLLMSESNSGYLLLIGAYRDNEVSSVHSLMLTLDEIKKVGAKIQIITLENLSHLKINQLVADTLVCAEELAWSLSQLVYQKTQGNPFFATQFLKALHQDKLIVFNFAEGCWQCDITQINQQALTDDVVEFMAFQLRRLPPATQQILKLAACIGNSFDLKTLAIVFEQSELETASCLWNALQEGLILPQNDIYKFYVGEVNQAVNQESSEIVAYKFLHDRVQQAAYSLILESEKKITHLKIGQLLLKNTSSEALELRIFDIVSQLNEGIELITQQSQKLELARLNLMAGKKAKTSTAYKSAVKHFTVGIAFLPENCWSIDYELTFALHREQAECEYFIGNFAQSEAYFDLALNSARDVFDQTDIYVLLMALRMTQGENIYASVDAGLKGLNILGMKLPDTSEELQALANLELEKLQAKLENVSPTDLFALPEMTQPIQKACMKILAVLWSASYLAGNQHLTYLCSLLMLNISLDYGSAETSSVAYGLYGINLANLGDYKTADEFGQLSLKLDRHFNNLQLIPKNNNHFGHAINPYVRHLNNNLPIYQQSFQISNDTGNLLYGVWAVVFMNWTMLIKGDRLPDIYAETEKYSNYVRQVNDSNMLHTFNLQQQFLLNLQNISEEADLLSDRHSQNISYVEVFQKNNFAIGISWYYLLKLQLLYLRGHYQEAVNVIPELEKRLTANLGFFPITQYYFYYPLTLLALYSNATQAEKAQYWEVLTQHQQQMKIWADNCPDNFLHRYLLLSAEITKISGKLSEALDLYDRAIAGAKENGYTQDEAIANELAAKFYLNWGKEKIAPAYMQEAYYCYARWGAKVKVEELTKCYPQLLQPILQQQRLNLNPLETIAFPGTSSSTVSSTTGSTSISDALDFISILKAAQAISSSIELDDLVTNLTRILLENSGAKKSVLILPHENTWQVKAITSINYPPNSPAQIQTILVSQPLDSCKDIPSNIIHYVKNTQQTVVINSLQTNIPGLIGEYILEHQPKSVFCTPIINQGHLVGILYLENKLTSGVFTTERLQLIHLLASQTAISLENAQLYQQAQQALQDLQQAQLKIVQSEKMSALGNLVAGVAHEMNNPLGFIAASLKQAKPTVADIVEHLKLYQESLSNPSEEILDHAVEIDLDYTLEDLPKVIDAMMMACDRLKNISTSLRTFSRADKDYKVPFNLHQGIDSTILILKHRLKANEQRPAIEVITDYGNLPQVECFPGQLNQVFMNIMANAIDALEESNNGRSFAEVQANPNRIKIITFRENNYVKITIADNGQGINEELKNKIFEHLFTTKAVGKGTGLGLAIARQIVEETHGGKLTCNSILGEGTEFLIEIPV